MSLARGGDGCFSWGYLGRLRVGLLRPVVRIARVELGSLLIGHSCFRVTRPFVLDPAQSGPALGEGRLDLRTRFGVVEGLLQFLQLLVRGTTVRVELGQLCGETR